MYDNNTNSTPCYSVSVTSQGPTDNTTAPNISTSFSGNTITFNHTDLSGTYVPQYTRYAFNNGTHNWYNSTDLGTTEPTVNANTLNPTYAWSLTANGGGVASFDPTTGVLTLSGAPTANITVRLTVSNISPLANKTVDFTLTRATVAESSNTLTKVTTPTISPSSAALYYNENQAFTSSATAAYTVTTTPAHTRLTGGGNTYYYYNGSLYANTDQFSTKTESPRTVTLSWSLSGDAASYLTRTPATGNTTTVTHSTQSTSDLTATLTVTASATEAVPTTATATITVYGPTVAPTITRSGDKITLATTSIGATIYYTTDGTTPSTSSTEYTGPFDLTTSPTTVKAIAIREGHSSEVATETFRLQLPAPVINIDNGGLATITAGAGSPSGTTFHYTTDGTTPTASSPIYSSSVQLTNPQIIKAIAVLSGYDDSEVASGDFITPGTADGKVILDDRENHSWSYYSDSECPIRSLNPADVKITYYGDGIVMTGNNDYTASSTDFVQPGNSNYVGGAKVNVGGENENTFIYYKTLERTDGSTSANPTGRCPYTPIPNPFQVRPTYGSRGSTDANNFTGWRGFQCWRLKSVTGGEVYSAASGGTALTAGAVINAETEIYFAPNSEYGMDVQFEAVWARAYLIKGNQGGENAILNYGNLGVERNFMTLTASENYRFNGTSGRRITNVDRAVTISCYYPSGEAPDGTNGVVAGNNNNITLGADTKFENVTLSAAAYTLTTSGHDVIIGRGCTTTNIGTVRGMSDGSTSAVDYTIRLESGTYGTFALIDNTARTFSSTVSTRAVFGSDYDRAKSDNSKLSIAANSTIYGGNAVHVFSSSSNRNNLTYDWLIKSGRVQGSKSVTDANADESIYIGNSGNNDNTRYMGKRRFTMEGGEIASLAGSLNSYGNNRNTYIVNEGDAVEIRVKGGTIRGSVYGAAAYASATGNRRFVFTGGDVRGWIAGGANGTQSDGGYLYGSTKIYIGGKTNVNSNSSTSVINRAVGGNVFGAGCGYGASSNSGQVTEGTTVVVADDSYVERGVYGGGSYGYTTNTSNVYVLGGHVGGKVGGVSGTSYSASITGGVFGGACQNQGGTVNITMTDGLVEGGVYGGSNATGTISGSVTMNINGGQVGTTSATANIHGGGYGSATRVSQNVDITLGTTTQTTPGVTVYGDVYGGSALGYVNGTAGTNTYHTHVTMNKGTINGSLYGGGLGNAANAANVYGPVAVKVYGGSVNTTSASGSGAVYGCNNLNGAPQRAVTVDIYGTDPAPSADTYALNAVYGGGNQADYSYGTPTVKVHNCDNSIAYVYGGGNAAHITNGNTDVTIYGGNKIGNVFGGGNGTVTAANVSGNTNVKIYGGTIGKVFGGSNSQGNIGGTISVTVAKGGEADTDPDGSSTACAMHIDEVYGGGNMAASNAGNISIGCTGNEGEGIGDLYGGANQADITGNIALNITGGSIQRVFGGNNTSGNISGTIAVNVNWNTTGACGNNYIGSVFGGGNLATYTGSPTVNILNGTVTGNVYGGGAGTLVDGADRGAAGKVTGNPTVNIGDNVNGHTAIVLGEVYGGGDAADVAGTPVIVVNDCNTQVGYLYGGGNAADVNGTNITINGGTFNTAFGGGHGDKDASNPSKYADVNGNVVFNVYGGTFNKVFAGSNSKGDITGTSALTINKTGTCDMKIGEVYGGGNEAAGNAGIVTIGCTGALTANHANVNVDNNTTNNRIGYELEGIGTVYGGANQANIGKEGTPSNITLNINSGMVANVFGGNNTSGTIYGTITVNIEKTSDACGWYVGNVFGGGNLASYTGSPTVNVKNGTVTYNVYGGGKGASAVVTGNPIVTIGDDNDSHYAIVTGDVYGGGDAAAVTGNTSVTYNDNNASSTVTKLFGGGNAAGVSGTTTVTMTSGKILAGIYGGCNSSGDIGGNITVNINGGTLGVSGTPLTSGIFGGGFGQSTTTAGNVTVNVGDANAASAAATPTIYGDIYGGSALGTVNDAVADVTTVNFNNGTIHGNIYGGGLGAATLDEHGYVASVTTAAIVNGTVHVNIGTSGQASNFVTIDGQVFGCNNFAGTPKGHVYVDVYHTAHSGANTYPSPEPTSPTDVAELASTAFAIGAVYGGGNLADYVTTLSGAKTHVHIHNCDNTIQYVYGGGNAASSPATDVTIDGGRFNYIFGGGNGAGVGNPGADIEHDAEVTLNGGLVYRAFGASNTKGVIGGTSSVDIPETTTCTRLVHELYGGGNEAAGGNVDLVIPCGSSGTGIIYAGANNADMGTQEDFEAGNPVLIKLTVQGGNFDQVFGGNNFGGTIWGNVELHLQGGTIRQAFGGNNAGGHIKGWIKVFVEEDETLACPLVLTDVYGGGKDAAYAPADYNTYYKPADQAPASPQVFIYHKKSGTAILGNVFGGGLGTTATVTANPQVIIGDYVDGHTVAINGDVYGGGDAGNVNGVPTVTVVNQCDITIGNVYGGGNAANVRGTNVKIEGGTITGMVFGGGHGDKASLNVDENDHSHSDKTANVNGNTSVTITGGTISKVFAGSNINGTISGTSNELIINKSDTARCDMKKAEVYGGGNLAAGNATSISVGCTGTLVTGNNGHAAHPENIGTSLEGIGYVYGGANQADIGTSETASNITVNINSGMVANVFGGNNTSGTIHGTITVNIEKNNAADCAENWYVGNVYGAGNLAAYTGSPAVNINNGTVSQNVYGGGKGAEAVVTGNPAVTIGDANASHYAIVSGDVYGGGDAAAVTGATSVTYNDANASSTVGRLFGGGNAAGVSSTATVTLTNGHVTAGVYGGCNASGSVGDVTIALNGGLVGAAAVGTEGQEGYVAEQRADVYGGGLGAATTTTGNIGVTLNGTTVYGDLYGGSALGSVNASTSNTATLTISSNTLHGSIYGGGKGDIAGEEGHSNVTATSNGGVIINYNTANADLAGLYGGANINGLVSGNIAVNVLANVGAAGDGNSLDIFGGGLGENTSTSGNVTVNVGDLTLDGSGNPVIAPVIYGAIYGGSALGQVNDAVTDVTTVNILSGTLHGNTYGGGLGETGGANVTKGQVNGSVIVNIGTGTVNETTGFATSTTGYATIDGSVYGCNNTNGSPKGDVTVNIYKTAHTTEDAVGYTGPSTPTYAIGNVFGGGRNADYSPVFDEGGGTTSSKRATVHVYGCDNTIEDVFGGGDAAEAYGVQTIIDGGRFDRVFGGGNGEVTAADIGAGGTNLQVHGGKITTLFGGSNTQGTITGDMGISVDATGECASDMYVDEFFCGNNLANIGTSENPVNINATIGCGARFGDVYGGCNLADIYGDVTLTILGGEMNNVYDGSKGRAGSTPEDAADITGNVTLNIHGGNISQNAYGGSNINGNITGNVTVNMDWSQASSDCNSNLHVGNIYGGSNLAAYTASNPSTAVATVNIKHGTVSHSVFGGGKGGSATVTANTAVTIGDGVAGHTATVTENVYGGGDEAKVVGGTSVTIAGGAYVSGDVYGGGNQADVTQNVSVSMTGGRVLNDIYGGGALANTNTDNWNASSAEYSYYGITGLTVGETLPSGLYYKPINYAHPQETTAVAGTTYYSYDSGTGTYTPVPAGSITVGTTNVSSYYIRSYGDYAAASGTVQEDVPYYEKVTGGWATGMNDATDGTTYKTTVSLTGGIIGHIADGTANDYRGGNVYGGGLGQLEARYTAAEASAYNAAHSEETGFVAVSAGDIKTPAVAAMVYGDVEVTVNGTAFIQRFVSPGGGNADVPFSGRVFGCNNLNGTPKGDVKVDVKKTIPVDASGNIVTLHDENKFEIHSVYGGGNLASYEPVDGKSLLVLIEGCEDTSIEKVFGGGNSAPVPSTQVVVLGSLYVGYAFGGGNGADKVWKNNTWNDNDGAPVYGNTLVVGVGGKIGQVFSGSDTKGTVYGNATVKLKGDSDVGDWTSDCPLKITNTYGAGRGADVIGDVVLIVSGCTEGNAIERVFGGSFDANIRGNINLTITSGIYSQVFGGNDHGGSIGGNITVNIEETDNCNPIVIQYLYGGGREAAYPGNYAKTESGADFNSGKITVNVKSATRIDNVFGGSYRAAVTGETEVNINMIKGNWVNKVISFPGTYRGDEIPNVTNPHIEYSIVSGLTPGTSYVNGLYTRSGDSEPYTYTKIESQNAKAEVGVTYYQLMMTGTVNDEIGTIGNVYGGSFESQVIGKTTVNIGTKNTIDIMKRVEGVIVDTSNNSIYDGEGNIRSGITIATESHTVRGANITGNVYGGGNNGGVTGNSQVNICAKESSTPGTYESVTYSTPLPGVTIHGTEYPYGVFGGGNKGEVGGNSTVYMGSGEVLQSIYGGGREADVKLNTHVEMLDGYVYDGVYGGGLKGSVGTFSRDATGHESHPDCVGGKPNVFTANTGKCTVIVSGGQIGPVEAAKDGMNAASIVDVGFVFGAGRGEVENPAVDKDADFHCYVYETDVTIKGTALVMASVYGGGENGRVRGNTLVKIEGGQIGCGDGQWETESGKDVPKRYTDGQFIDPTETPVTDSYALTECSHWPYGRNKGTDENPDWVYEPFDPYADDVPELYPGGSTAHPSDGKTYYGCVFGGGSGYYPYVKATNGSGTVTDYEWLESAGWVEGNTEVVITGGHILTNVYGGNEYTNVGGYTKVKMSGGTLGVPRTLAQIAAHPLTCYIFGAGKGDQRSHFNVTRRMTNVATAIVEINDSVSKPIIYGSVFGGAEDGHVFGNAHVTIKKMNGNDPVIGTWGTSYVDGNVFGGGRGFSGTTLAAGSVKGNTNINISAGKILGSIYGGGRMASVGVNFNNPQNADTGQFEEDGDGKTYGHVTINISGGTIGNERESAVIAADGHTKGGNVFGGSMGRLTLLNGAPNGLWTKLAQTKTNSINITGGTIKSNVYGGSEYGTTRDNVYVTFGGSRDASSGDITPSGSPTVNGHIYGGGYGSDITDPNYNGRINATGSITYLFTPMQYAGIVGGDAYVNVVGGQVKGHVFGGGELASVGIINYQVDDNDDYLHAIKHDSHSDDGKTYYDFGLSWPYEFEYIPTLKDGSTYRQGGKTHVNIKGSATVGQYDASGVPTSGGYVFGGGKGQVSFGATNAIDEQRFTEAHIANVRETEITIGTSGGSDNPTVRTVYGGGDDGHVMENASITIHRGTIKRSVFGGGKGDRTFTTKLLDPSTGNQKATTDEVYSWTAGKVYGNTSVTMNGGSVGWFIYGGGNVASVGKGNYSGGSDDYSTAGYGELPSADGALWSNTNFTNSGNTTITIMGGTVGTADGNENGIPYGSVFGGSRGRAAKTIALSPRYKYGPDFFLGYINKSTVNIGGKIVEGATTLATGDGPTIKGSVYGGAQDGHVRNSTEVHIFKGSLPGQDPTVDINKRSGNVFGAGSGIGKYQDGSNLYCNNASGSVTCTTLVDVTGGTIAGSVYGGGALASVGPPMIDQTKNEQKEVTTTSDHASVSHNTVNIGGGSIGGSVYAASRGPAAAFLSEAFTGGVSTELTGPTYYNPATYATSVWTDLTITGGTIAGNVYGGGEMGRVKESTNVQLKGGTIYLDAYGGGKGSRGDYPIPAGVLGNTTLELNKGVAADAKGCVVRKVYGANDFYGTPRGHVLVHVYATQNSGTATISDKIAPPAYTGARGGEEGYKAYLTRLKTEATATGGLSGSHAAITAATTLLESLSGVSEDEIGASDTHKNNITNAANAIIDALKAMYNYDVQAVYGGGDLAMYEPTVDGETTEVIIEGCDVTSIKQVYGGGNAAPVSATNVLVKSCFIIDEVFGGGNGKDNYTIDGEWYENPGANVGYRQLSHYVTDGSQGNGLSEATKYAAITNTTSSPAPYDKDATTPEGRRANYAYGSGVASTTINGGHIHAVYGSSNEKGNIRSEAISTYQQSGTCQMIMDNTYGGSKSADNDAEIVVNLDCVENGGNYFGGSYKANIFSNVNINITNGTYDKIFGGNDRAGTINGSITINIQENGCTPIRINELYAGGNLAPYSIYGYKDTTVDALDENGQPYQDEGVTVQQHVPYQPGESGALPTPYEDPRINIISATHIGTIYGGGYGGTATLIGSPHVNVNMTTGRIREAHKDYKASYATDYPTSDADGNRIIPIGIIGTIFGGGNKAEVVGDTYVEIGTGKWVNRDGKWETEDASGDKYTYEEKSTGTWKWYKVGVDNDEGTTTAPTPARNAAFITESVYGGGNNGDVTGNTIVEISNGYVADRVYGGGNLGNVGTISARASLPTGHASHTDCLGGAEPTAFAANTGKCTVTVNGGRVGPFTYSASAGVGVVTPQEMSMTKVGGPDDFGYVFGASRGALTDPTVDTDIDYKTFVDNTEVTIDGTALIAGGVYGGSENGRVLHDTKVYIKGGQIGIGEGMTTAFNAGTRTTEAYTDEEWAYDVTADDTKSLAECSHWPYVAPYAPYDPNALSTGLYANGASAGGGMPTGSDGHTFYGNVFGGGSGYFPYRDSNGQSQWLETAGEVKGNTYLTITGGHILTSIYGGNEMTNVLGNTYVTMVGGTLGVPRTLSQIAAHPVTCYLFGAGKGDPRIFFNTQTNVANAIVHISDDARIYGSVFGGGEDGHVLGDATMSIGSSTLPTAVSSDPVLSALTLSGKKTVGGIEYPYLGTWGTSYVDGNVFGGGRGFSGEALTAGNTGGNVNLSISGGTMLGSVYGGGRMAGAGINLEMPTLANGDPNPHYGLLKDETGANGDPTFGHVTVNISGGTIGNDLEQLPVPRSITTDAALNTWKTDNHIPNTDFYFGKDDNDDDLYLLHHTKGGNVFGGSMGRNTHLDGSTNALWPKLAVVKLTDVTISGNANIKGNVYGGGELGVVRNMATVNVEGGTIHGSVYGGGYGSDDDRDDYKVTISAGGYDDIATTYYTFTPMIWNGCVAGNTYVNVSGGWVKKSVYGGGEMASVGLINCNVNAPGAAYNYITKHDDLSNSFALSWPYAFQYISAAPLDATSAGGRSVGGKTTVNITGGRIGITGKDYIGPVEGMSEEEQKARRTDNGDIYGGSKGISEEKGRYRTAFSSNVKETEVTINYASSNAATPQNYKTDVSVSAKNDYDCIAGSVYGGGEDGHVIEDSRVTLSNGLVGHALYGGGKGKTEFTTKLLKIGARQVSGDGNSIEDYNPADTYDANVYGFISGRVLGNTHVNMSGGYVVRNVYGGGNMASVGKGNYAGGPDDYFTLGYGELTGTENLWDGVHDNSQAFLGSGKTNVTVTGGQVGYVDDDPAKSVKDGLPYGNIFGGCRGESAPNTNEIPPFLYTPTSYAGYVNETKVTIGEEGKAGPMIYGSVYGGGQDGHVRRDALVVVNSGEIGVPYASDGVIGSPYTSANCNLGGLTVTDSGTGETSDNIQWLHRGNVYGSGSGISKYKYDFNYDGTIDENEQDYSQSSGSVTRFAQVDVFGGTIHRNVYGGGSRASVGPPPNPMAPGTYPYRKDDPDHATEVGKQSQSTVNVKGMVGSPTGYNEVYGGEVYGGSRGDSDSGDRFSTVIWTKVNIMKGAHVKGNVFGGGDAGKVNKDTDVIIGAE